MSAAFCGGGFAEFVVARVKERAGVAFNEHHRRAETVAGGVCGDPDVAELERLSIGNFDHPPRGAHAEPV